jgi:hypothetical protein
MTARIVDADSLRRRRGGSCAAESAVIRSSRPRSPGFDPRHRRFSIRFWWNLSDCGAAKGGAYGPGAGPISRFAPCLKPSGPVGRLEAWAESRGFPGFPEKVKAAVFFFWTVQIDSPKNRPTRRRRAATNGGDEMRKAISRPL